MKYKINIFHYINTLECKRNKQFSNNNVKSKEDEGIQSPVAWVIGKYATHCDAMLVWSGVLIAL